MRHRNLEHLTLLVQTSEGGVGLLHPHPHRPGEEPQPGISHQATRQEPRLAQDLEAVANAEHRAAGARVLGYGAHHPREPGDRAGAQIVSVAEAAGEDYHVGLPQIAVAMPYGIGVGARRVRCRERFRVAVGAGKDDHRDAFHRATPPSTARS